MMYNHHPVDRLPCECYKCVGPQYEWDQESASKRLANNMEYHTFLEECRNCGRPKTEYKDLAHKGRYVCWWCRNRAERTRETALVPAEVYDGLPDLAISSLITLSGRSVIQQTAEYMASGE